MPISASEAGGVQRVHIAPVAVGGRPWMEGGANFAICMTMANGEVATCRWNSKGRAESGTGVTWSAGGVALDLPGPDAVAQARGQRRWHSEVAGAGLEMLYGGADDANWRAVNATVMGSIFQGRQSPQTPLVTATPAQIKHPP